MTFRRFHNALRILLNIDRHEAERAGVDFADIAASRTYGDAAHMAEIGWQRFRDDPWRVFIECSDSNARALWSIIEARQPPAVDATLPCEVVCGPVRFGKGIHLHVLVEAARRWLAAAQRVDPRRVAVINEIIRRDVARGRPLTDTERLANLDRSLNETT